MKYTYFPLSENGGLILKGETPCRIEQHGHMAVIIPVSPEEARLGKVRPTIVNKDFFDSLMKEDFAFRTPPPDKVNKDGLSYKYRSLMERQDALSPEYQLYLAHEMERAVINKASKTIGNASALAELTGLLPHEEEQDEH